MAIDLVNHLVAQYKLNDNAATTAVVDSQGLYNGTAARNTSLMHITGKIGGAFALAENDKITIADAVAFTPTTNGFCACAWVKINGPGYFIYIANKDATDNYEWWFEIDEWRLAACVTDMNNYPADITSYSEDLQSALEGQWAFVAMVYDGTNNENAISLYINGTEVSYYEQTKNGNFQQVRNYNSPLYLCGNETLGMGADVNASIDNVMIFDKALNEDEITFLYNLGSGTESAVCCTITASAGGTGSISPSGTLYVPYGSSRAFTATPGTGYYSNEWLVDGGNFQTSGDSFTLADIIEDHTVKIVFSPDQRTIKAIVEQNRPEELPGGARGHSHNIVIHVLNNPITGISTSKTVTSENDFEAAAIEAAAAQIETMGRNIIYVPYADTIDTGRDQVKLSVQFGATAQVRRITGILSQDAGMLELEVR